MDIGAITASGNVNPYREPSAGDTGPDGGATLDIYNAYQDLQQHPENYSTIYTNLKHALIIDQSQATDPAIRDKINAISLNFFFPFYPSGGLSAVQNDIAQASLLLNGTNPPQTPLMTSLGKQFLNIWEQSQDPIFGRTPTNWYTQQPSLLAALQTALGEAAPGSADAEHINALIALTEQIPTQNSPLFQTNIYEIAQSLGVEI